MRILSVGLLLALTCQAQAPSQSWFNAKIDPEIGRKLFAANCAACHGADGKGGRGSDLTTGLLRHGGTPDDLYRTIHDGLAGTEMPAFAFSGVEFVQLLAFVRGLGHSSTPPPEQGDAAKGETLFVGVAGCAGCHRVGNAGARTGPDLSNIGRRLKPSELQAALLHPEERVQPENWFVRAVTGDGRTITGRRLNEDTYNVQLLDSHEQLVSLNKADLRQYELLRKPQMPGYEGKLNREQLNDLVAYLSTLREEQ